MWFITPPATTGHTAVMDFYLGRRVVMVQTTQSDSGYAFVMRLNENLAYESVVIDSIVPVPRNGIAQIDLSAYPLGYYRVVAGSGINPQNYKTYTGLGSVFTPPLPVLYKSSETHAYTLPSSPSFRVSFPVFPELRVDWVAQDPDHTYKLEWRKQGDSSFSVIESLAGESHTLKPCEYGEQYDIRLSAKSDVSGAYSLPHEMLVRYPADTLESPCIGVVGRPSAILVEWDAVPHAASYIVRYKFHSVTTGWTEQILTDTSCLIENLEPFEQYDIEVVARASGYIDSLPAGLLINTIGKLSSIDLSVYKHYPLVNVGEWSHVVLSAAIITYEVRYNAEDDFDSSSLLGNFALPLFAHHVPISDTTYFYWVRPVTFFAGQNLFGDWTAGIVAGIPSVIMPMSYRIHLDVTDYPEVPSETPFSVKVEWGDGEVSEYHELRQMPQLTHDFSAAGVYYAIFTLLNNCGVTRSTSTITLVAGLADNPLNVFEKSASLVIFDVEPSPKTDDNVPPVTITGEMRQYLLETGEYGYETIINADTELIKFPPVYELIPADKLVLGDTDPDSNLSEHNTENLEWAVSHVLHDFSATLFADLSFSIVFEYFEMSPPRPTVPGTNVSKAEHITRHFNTFDVAVRGDSHFFARFSCPDSPASSPVSNGDGTYTSVISFSGRHISGFQFDIQAGNEARLHDVMINVLQKDGSISRLSQSLLDVYSLAFITNLTSLFDKSNPTPSVVFGKSSGYIPFSSTFDIDHVEILCDAAVKNRILFDSFKIVGNKYLLTIKNTSENPQDFKIPITTGKTGSIFLIEAFRFIPPDIENLPIVFRQDINARRNHVTYFYRQSSAGSTLVSQDSFESPVSPFAGTGTLETLYGTIKFSFFDNNAP